MPGGRLANKLVLAYDSANVYSVPAGVDKVSFSLVADSDDSSSFDVGILYSNSSITDDVIDYKSSNEFTLDYTFLENILIDKELTDASITSIPSGYTSKDIRVFQANSTSNYYLTKDQKYIWASANSEWRAADDGFHYHISLNNESTQYANLNAIVLMFKDTSTLENGSVIYHLDQSSFLKVAQTNFTSTLSCDFFPAAHGNYRTFFSTDYNLYVIRGDGSHRYETTQTISSINGTSNVSVNWVNIELNNLSVNDPAWYYNTTEAYAIRLSDGQLYYSASMDGGLGDTSWNWSATGEVIGSGFATTNFAAMSNAYLQTDCLIYPINSPSVMFIGNNASSTTQDLSSIGAGLNACVYEDGSNYLIVTDTNFFSGTEAGGFTELGIPDSYSTNLDQYTTYVQSLWGQKYFSASTSDAITIDYSFSSSFTGRLLGTFSAGSANVDILTFSENSYFYILGTLDQSFESTINYIPSSNAVLIDNCVLSETFYNITKLEVSGRLIGSGDSIKVYSDSDINVTIMGIEE